MVIFLLCLSMPNDFLLLLDKGRREHRGKGKPQDGVLMFDVLRMLDDHLIIDAYTDRHLPKAEKIAYP
ncbi:MAG: hypothetical protein NTW27_11945 [Deltaproteobacteria bacterium]|nr:hypothetical protein [Deltaproteobacteria bacterium]